MIPLQASTSLMLYLAILLGLLAVAWIRSSRVRTRRLRLPQENQLYVCEYCTFVYLDSASKEVTRCPQCTGYNKHNLYRKKEKPRFNKKTPTTT